MNLELQTFPKYYLQSVLRKQFIKSDERYPFKIRRFLNFLDNIIDIPEYKR